MVLFQLEVHYNRERNAAINIHKIYIWPGHQPLKDYAVRPEQSSSVDDARIHTFRHGEYVNRFSIAAATPILILSKTVSICLLIFAIASTASWNFSLLNAIICLL